MKTNYHSKHTPQSEEVYTLLAISQTEENMPRIRTFVGNTFTYVFTFYGGLSPWGNTTSMGTIYEIILGTIVNLQKL